MDRVTHPITAQSSTRGPTPELLTGSCQSVTQNTKGNMLVIPTNVGANSVIDVTHQYDALGRRVARTASGSTTVFVQVDQQTICDYVSGEVPASSTYRYLYGSYIDEPIVRIATSNSETTWYYRNQRYSIIACTDPTGAATEQYAYAAYGLLNITDGTSTVSTFSAINSRYTHTGREWDAVPGMYHYPAGMYEATVDRFCSRDPIGYVDGFQMYGFLTHQPVFQLDPSGKAICDCSLLSDSYSCRGGFSTSSNLRTDTVSALGNDCSVLDWDERQPNYDGVLVGRHYKCKARILTTDETSAASICNKIGPSGTCPVGCTKAKCEEAVAALINAIRNTHIWNILGMPLGPNACIRWAEDCHRRLPNLEANPCVKMAVVHTIRVNENLGLTTDHAMVKILFCNGATINADVGTMGGKDDHILPPTGIGLE